jgi:hypothetical protein
MYREDENVLVAQAVAWVFPRVKVINTAGTFASTVKSG